VVSAAPVPRTAPHATREMVLEWLGEVMDPEVPVVSVVDLGIVRDVQQLAETMDWVVTVTPTYSGCPATEVIAASIREALQARGVGEVEVRTQLSPAWTTDWMTPKGREALRGYGIAPPVLRAPGVPNSQVIDITALMPHRTAVPCPRCASRKTRLLSQFGSTACKALYQCSDCLEPFDYFKPH
jgi:ring-1,2-phenylacetyl-CoA epoxidase subunit PaaD